MSNEFDPWAANPSPKTQEQEKATEESQEKSLADLLSTLPGAPNKAQLDAWKDLHGEVFCSATSMTEMFIFRSLTRQEFIQLQVAVSDPKNEINQFDVEEKVVGRCCLWFSPDAKKALESKAGTYSTLHEQIMQNSNFVNPAMASALVVKL